jgi:nickel superoxide dismutase
MNRTTLTLTLTATAALLLAGLNAGSPRTADAHCQVPCGIYDDPARIVQMHEDAATIAKAIAQMNELAGKDDALSHQQFVRWANTKEEHASRIIDTVSTYFLTQKLKPVAPEAEGYDAYLKKLADHHAVMVAAMKAKQNADPAAADALGAAIDALKPYWAPDHAH